jgi:hypothetical protein
MCASVLAPATMQQRCSPPSWGPVSPCARCCCTSCPGDPGYGSALLGYHYYSWAFIGFAVAIVLIAVVLLFDGQFEGDTKDASVEIGAFASVAVWLVIALTALNVMSILLECGFGSCPDDPVGYELLKRGP